MAKKKKPTLTKEEKEEISAKKKFESKWLNKSYFDSTPFKLSKGDISLKQLRFGTIASHELLSVQIGLDVITLKSSWIELILIMLSQIIDTYKEKYRTILEKYEVTNTAFCVEKVYGNYSFDNIGYTVYKIYDTGYYLEAILDERNVFLAILHLVRALEIDPNTLRFKIIAKSLKDKKQEIVKDSLNYKTSEATIDECYERLENDEHIAYAKIFEEFEEVHRLDIILLMFCNIIYDKYGMTKMISIPNNKGTGICINELSAEHPCSRIRNSMLLVYTDGDNESILDFMSDTIETLKIDNSKIKIGFKEHSTNTHEWEVD